MLRFRPLLLLVVAVLAAGCTATTAQTPLTARSASNSNAANNSTANNTGGYVVAASDGITVSGTGRISGRPDVLRATIGVEAVRPTVEEALEAANQGAAQVLEALRSAGVADEDLQTRDLSVYPRYDNMGTQVTGYAVRNLVEAAIRDLDGAGELLGEVIRTGGDDARLEQVTFDLEDNAALLDDARERAFAEARRKAEQYAGLAGGSLGRLVRVEETTGSPPMPLPFQENAAGGDAASMPIAPGAQEVSVQVLATWELS